MRVTLVNSYSFSSLSRIFSPNSPISLTVIELKNKIISKIMSVTNNEDKSNQQNKRIKRNKYAVLLGYCGSGYFGLQRNPGVLTIEEEFLKACLAKKFITENEFENIHEIKFQRAARTDKGVSAAVQVLSMCLPTEKVSSLASELNEVLPEKIHVYGAIRTTKYFDAKNYCCGRTYSYLLPTFALAPPESKTDESFRASKEIMDEFNKILNYYRGTHNFHNFTSGKENTDTSAMRYIVSIECGQPFVLDGLEFAVIRLRGQSFMLHQIRKMVGMAIAIMKGFANIKALEESFGPKKMDVPRAPGLGLMLEDVHYERYNQKFGGKGIHENLSWSQWSEEIFQFKEKHIYPLMVQTEKDEKSMLNWLPNLVLHTFEERRNDENNTKLGEAMYSVDPEKFYKLLDDKRIANDEPADAETAEDGPSNIEVEDDEIRVVNKSLVEEDAEEENIRKKLKS